MTVLSILENATRKPFLKCAKDLLMKRSFPAALIWCVWWQLFKGKELMQELSIQVHTSQGLDAETDKVAAGDSNETTDLEV